MLKKILLSVLCFSFIGCAIPSQVKAEENTVTEEYLYEWKENIGKNAYFIYTPRSEHELLNLGEEDVIAIFEGVKVTKKLLNNNLELDIDKITVNDFVDQNYIPSFESSEMVNFKSEITPYAMQLPDIGVGAYNGTYTVPSYADSVIVTRTNQFSDGTNSAEVVHYLSNSDFKIFVNKISVPTEVSWRNTWYGILGIILVVLPQYLGLTIDVLAVAGDHLEEAFQNKIVTLNNTSGVKAKITINGSYKSVVQWTDNKFYARNESLNGSIFKSQVEFS